MGKNLILRFLTASLFGIILSLCLSARLYADGRVSEAEGGNIIPCWSAGGGIATFHRYVDCGSCASKLGRADGERGECSGGVNMFNLEGLCY